jgi:hypothetical protein
MGRRGIRKRRGREKKRSKRWKNEQNPGFAQR